MLRVSVRFYAELNRFLTEHHRGQPLVTEAPPGSTTKSLVENLGVPHTEIDLVIVNGQSVSFSHRLQDGDRVSVYPVFESWDIGAASKVRAVPLRVTKFLADVHLGRLARQLRMMGFDTAWADHLADASIVKEARAAARIILTRDRGLLKRRLVTHGYLVRSLEPREQLAEVIARFDLSLRVRLFTRCMECNVPLARVPRLSVLDAVPSAVAETCSDFSRCPRCGKVFWRGTHWESMKRLAADVLASRQVCDRRADVPGPAGEVLL